MSIDELLVDVCKCVWKNAGEMSAAVRFVWLTDIVHEVIVPVCPLLVLAWSSESPRGQWRTGKNGENWMQNHLWYPNDPRG